MIQFRKFKERAPYESVVPLINVVFLLLIFFLLAGVLGPTDPVEISPPQGEIDELDPVEPLTLFLDHEGFVYLDEQILGPEIVGSTVALIFAERGPKEVVLKADKKAQAHDLISVLESLRTIQVEEVKVITMEPDQ